MTFPLLHALKEDPCDACGTPVPHGVRQCSCCGTAVLDEIDLPSLDVLVGPASARHGLGHRSRNLEKLLASLYALECGNATTSQAVALVDTIINKFRRWWADLSSLKEANFWNAEETRMHGDYLHICGRLLPALDAYRSRLLSGNIRGARAHMLTLEEGFSRLLDLKDHYAAAGFR